MQRFEFIETELSGLKVVKRKPIGDSRGYLCRLFCAETYALHGFSDGIPQINHTLTVKQGVVRGMHYQLPPHAEIKLVSCIQGQIFDVAVDLRKGSPTFLKWHAEILSAENHTSLLIPEGFAHGFQTLTDDCDLLYLHSMPYHQAAEAALNAMDPTLSITWPLAIAEMSERDRSHLMLNQDFKGITL